jgi:Mg2+ and Co2+ transporter CorA
MPKHVHTLTSENTTWVNITKVSETALDDVKRRFNLLDSDIRDCLPPLQRPKIVQRQNYIFMVLLFPVFDRETLEIDST